MPVLSTALGLGLAAASATAGAIGRSKAAKAQAQGAQSAQALEAANQQKAIDFQTAQTKKEEALQQPYLDAGTQGTNSLRKLLATPGQGLLQNYGAFTAPTLADAENMPGYQFEKKEGIDSLDQSAAARGNLFSGTQGKALVDYGNNVATTNYQQAYQNALTGYNSNFNTFETNQGNQYNRLRDLAGVGQTAANASTQAEQAAANNVGEVLVNGGQQQAQQVNNAAAARASGDKGIGDSIAGGLNYGANYALDVNAQQELQQENAVSTPYNPAIWINRGSGYPQYPNVAAPAY